MSGLICFFFSPFMCSDLVTIFKLFTGSKSRVFVGFIVCLKLYFCGRKEEISTFVPFINSHSNIESEAYQEFLTGTQKPSHDYEAH